MKYTDDVIEELAQKLARSFTDELVRQTKEKNYNNVYELILYEYGGVVETTLKIDINKGKKEIKELTKKDVKI